MLTLVILLVLAYSYYTGSQRGIKLQALHTLGYLVSLLLATVLYRVLAPKLELLVPYPSATEQSSFVFFSNQVGLTLDTAFYRGVAFMLVLGIGWLLTRFAALWVHDLTYAPSDPKWSPIAGGAMNLVMGYLFVFLALFLVALIPEAGLQEMLANSIAARTIVRYSLGLTQLFTVLWIG